MSYYRDEANRENAMLSTGPRTLKGKARSSQNALRYAFLSGAIVLPGEDTKALSRLRGDIRDHFRPVGPVERILVEQMVSSLWRLGRLRRIEAAILGVSGKDQAEHVSQPSPFMPEDDDFPF